MKPFEFIEPTSIEQALAGSGNTSKYIAGGTNLVDLMKRNIQQPEMLLGVTKVISGTIEQTAKGLVIGAMAKNTAMATHPEVLNNYPLLSKAILKGASPQIRNMATAGGNMLQRTRCAYFYDTSMACNKRKNGSGCSAKNGLNRMGAIVGYSDACVAVHPSDMCIALVALDAEVEVVTANGETKNIKFEDFHRLPGNNPEKDNNLPENALITSIFIPKNKFADHTAYIKLRDRESYAFALISVAAALEIKGNKIKEARLASGGVAHKPWRWKEAEKYLKGKTATAGHFSKAAEIATEGIIPLSDNAFKVPMLKGAIETALFNCITNGN